MKNLHIFSLFFVFLPISLKSQSFQISGKIIDQDFLALPGVSIYDQDTTLLATSDMDGNFELSVQKSKLIFAYLGMEWEHIEVTQNCSFLEILMLNASTYHIKSHRKIDRKRKKIFDARPGLHEQAFKKGIFENSSPCFEYYFEPDKPDLDEIRKWIKKKKVEIRKEYEQLGIGDTILVPYSGPRTSSIQSPYSDYLDYECLVKGVVISKDRKRKGYNLLYRVIDLDTCVHEELTNNQQVVVIGDSIRHNMRFARTITASNNGYK